MSTRAQRFQLAARMAEHWSARLQVRSPITRAEKKALLNFLQLVRNLMKEV